MMAKRQQVSVEAKISPLTSDIYVSKLLLTTDPFDIWKFKESKILKSLNDNLHFGSKKHC